MRERQGEPVWLPFEHDLKNAKFTRWDLEDKTGKANTQILLSVVKDKDSDVILLFLFHVMSM